jgi:DNA-binding LytR/AlgR family response regulator
MSIRCIIVDDEPVARKVLQEYVEDIGFLELVGQAEDPLSAMALLDQASPPVDLIFLDIHMPKISGIDFLKNTKTDLHIVMTTAYSEHAVEAFTLDVTDYLVKPISFERFLKACNKVRSLIEANASPAPAIAQEDHFFIKCNGKLEKVAYQELIYAEAMLNYVMLHTATRKMMVYVTIRNLEEQLPPALFIKVHKSFIVNRTKIKSIDGNTLDVGTASITISQTLREKVIREVVQGKMISR